MMPQELTNKRLLKEAPPHGMARNLLDSKVSHPSGAATFGIGWQLAQRKLRYLIKGKCHENSFGRSNESGIYWPRQHGKPDRTAPARSRVPSRSIRSGVH